MRQVTFTLGRHNKGDTNIQKVSYFYATTGKEDYTNDNIDIVPIKQTYDELREDNANIVVAFNYTPLTSSNTTMDLRDTSSVVTQEQGGGLSWGVTTQGSGWDSLTVLRREIWEEQGNVMGEKYFSPILVNQLVQGGGFIDYNVSDDRTYQYIFYPFLNAEAEEGKVGWGYSSIVSTKWNHWSLTELHPTDDKYTFVANPSDVWLFKYNMTPSTQRQNFLKTEQKNLSAYPKFSLGTQNNMSADVSCLLGSEITCQELLNTKNELVVQEISSIDNGLIYSASPEFFKISPPVVSENPFVGVYSFGLDQVIVWCAKKKEQEYYDISSEEVQGAFKALYFNYYGTIKYYLDEDERTVAPIFNTTLTKRTISSTNSSEDKIIWAKERELMDNSYHIWTVKLPDDSQTVPALTTTSSLYYATPGYQLGEPRQNGNNKSFGVYLKRHLEWSESLNKYINIEWLVFWFKNTLTVSYEGVSNQYLSEEEAVRKMLSGETSQYTIPFYVNGYFQNSGLQALMNTNPISLVDLNSRPDSSIGLDWQEAYDSILPDQRTYAHFYGFRLNPSVQGTNGRIEKVKAVPKILSSPLVKGGYQEKMPFTKQLTSNEKVDMLNAWRKICCSGNPKLLKDNKGQKFLVQITQSSNTPVQSTGTVIPEKIDFSWVEIGDANKIVVTGQITEELP